jgi:hypothetical protein
MSGRECDCEALPPTGDVAKLVEELKYQIAPYSVGDLFDRTADALTAANARIAEVERELEARKNYTDEDYVTLHNAHCFTANKLATATAHAERLEALLKTVPSALSYAFAAGMEESEGGSARRQAISMKPVEELRAAIRAALTPEGT